MMEDELQVKAIERLQPRCQSGNCLGIWAGSRAAGLLAHPRRFPDRIAIRALGSRRQADASPNAIVFAGFELRSKPALIP